MVVVCLAVMCVRVFVSGLLCLLVWVGFVGGVVGYWISVEFALILFVWCCVI